MLSRRKSLPFWAFALIGLLTLPGTAGKLQAATLTLFDWGIVVGSVDSSEITTSGTSFNGQVLPSYIDASGFQFDPLNANAGLGTVKINFTAPANGPGLYFIYSYFDYDLSPDIDLRDIGSTIGSPSAGAHWQIDEWTNLLGGFYQLPPVFDDQNHLATNTGLQDAALGLGFDFVLNPGESITATLQVGTAAPASGFYLTQSDPGNAQVFLQGSLDSTAVPEPGTALLTAGAFLLAGVAAKLSRRRKA